MLIREAAEALGVSQHEIREAARKHRLVISRDRRGRERIEAGWKFDQFAAARHKQKEQTC
jgi:hypothetical protein